MTGYYKVPTKKYQSPKVCERCGEPVQDTDFCKECYELAMHQYEIERKEALNGN